MTRLSGPVSTSELPKLGGNVEHASSSPRLEALSLLESQDSKTSVPYQVVIDSQSPFSGSISYDLRRLNMWRKA